MPLATTPKICGSILCTDTDPGAGFAAATRWVNTVIVDDGWNEPGGMFDAMDSFILKLMPDELFIDTPYGISEDGGSPGNPITLNEAHQWQLAKDTAGMDKVTDAWEYIRFIGRLRNLLPAGARIYDFRGAMTGHTFWDDLLDDDDAFNDAVKTAYYTAMAAGAIIGGDVWGETDATEAEYKASVYLRTKQQDTLLIEPWAQEQTPWASDANVVHMITSQSADLETLPDTVNLLSDIAGERYVRLTGPAASSLDAAAFWIGLGMNLVVPVTFEYSSAEIRYRAATLQSVVV